MVNERTRRIPPLLALVLGSAAVAAVIMWVFAPAKEPLPRLFPMPDFELTSEQGEPFSAEALDDQVVVANFIFTRCPTVCPMLTAKMAQLQETIPADLPVRFLSFSVDPKHDTPEVLRAFGEDYDQDPARWTFLTGDLKEITEAVEAGFKIGMKGADDPDATPFDIVHGEHFVLVGRDAQIRGYYPNDEASLAQLVRDARELVSERRG